jgi:hypothetical protein
MDTGRYEETDNHRTIYSYPVVCRCSRLTTVPTDVHGCT